MAAPRFTSLLVMLLGAAVVLTKAAYATTWLGARKTLPWAVSREVVALAVSAWLLVWLGARAGRGARGMRAALLGAWLLALAVYVATFAAHGVLGMRPRLEFLRGLTWAMIGPSILPMAQSHRGALAGAAVGLAAAGWALWRVRGWFGRLIPSRRGGAALGMAALALLVDAELRGRAVPARVDLLSRALEGDANPSPVSMEEFVREREWFARHDALLRAGVAQDARYAPLLAAARGQNLVFVTMESVRAADLSAYGGPVHMPFLESLGPQLVRLDRLYAQDVRSTKSFAAFELGEYELPAWESYSHGLTRGLREQSLARQLNGLGYRTLTMVNGDPLYDNNAAFHRARGYHRVLYQPDIVHDGSNNSDDLALLDRVDEELAAARGQPVYLQVWPMATHHPYGREYWSDIPGWLRAHPGGIQHKGDGDRARFHAALLDLDDFLRRLVALTRKHGIYERTTFVFAGDHGEAFGEHAPDNIFHGVDVYEESVRVAGFVHHASLARPEVEDRVFMLKDLPASLMDLAGTPEPFLGAGRSVFRQYAHPMPAYLFNSFTRTAGLLQDGWKLRLREGMARGARLEDIAADPSAEDRPLPPGNAAALQQSLSGWQDAMAIRSRRLLAEAQPVQGDALSDMVRVYCDPGDGFSEQQKASLPFDAQPGSASTVTVPMGRRCKALRVAPLMSSVPPAGVQWRYQLLGLSARPAPPASGEVAWRLGNVAAALRDSDTTFLYPPGAPTGNTYFDVQFNAPTDLDAVELRFQLDARKP